jgi:methyl-accepting chemotaxis protein
LAKSAFGYVVLLRLAGGELSRSFLSDGKKETARLFNDELKQIGYKGQSRQPYRVFQPPSYTTFYLSDHSLWQSRPLDDKYVALAYVGTANKQMFTYPKADFAKDYDPTNRTWYKMAAEKPDKVLSDLF